ncbi:hypothetical protein NQ314_018622 [Rhamnusium bicolor]|uniref:SRCR domain-containing protein n=1 Tax=Rhamnusium bicolor TaxID=1586634 RepID=A0AAV8WPU7_9CUCU|nr:hypothetical protein NQ314_018622 [Rhamnusium bicolor]
MFQISLPRDMKIRLKGGRIAMEGRVEIKIGQREWEVICGDGWSLLEALVVCKSLSLGWCVHS